MDLSNKSLALMLLAAIVISLGGTIISLQKLSDFDEVGETFTGRATGSGWTRVNITTSVGCAVDKNVDFGTAAVTDPTLLISSELDNLANGFGDCTAVENCSGMDLNNTGNTDLNINFSSAAAASTFLGGEDVAAGDFQFAVYNGTSDNPRVEPGCRNSTTSGSPLTGWTSWSNVVTTQTLVCNNMTPDNTNDMLTLEFNITARSSTPGGNKNTTITFNCNQI